MKTKIGIAAAFRGSTKNTNNEVAKKTTCRTENMPMEKSPEFEA